MSPIWLWIWLNRWAITSRSNRCWRHPLKFGAVGRVAPFFCFSFPAPAPTAAVVVVVVVVVVVRRLIYWLAAVFIHFGASAARPPDSAPFHETVPPLNNRLLIFVWFQGHCSMTSIDADEPKIGLELLKMTWILVLKSPKIDQILAKLVNCLVKWWNDQILDENWQ